MKQLKILVAFTLAVLMTSCGTYQSTTGGGGGFWNDASNFIDYGISQWESHMPADSYDHTLIDAWRSGTGGKALIIGEIAVGAIGGISGKDVSAIKDRIHNASKTLTEDKTYSENNVKNWVGGLFNLGSELYDEYESQKFEETVAILTDPTAYGYNEEDALRVKSIDYENRKIIWKSNTEFMRDLIEYRSSKNKEWFSNELESVCGMSMEEYNNLPNDTRQEIDLKILENEATGQANHIMPSDSNATKEPITETEPKAQDAVDYGSFIRGIVISDYGLNSFSLSEAQKDELDRISEILQKDESIELVIYGHACIIGTDKANYSIGLKRADTAKNYLIESGIDGQRIIVESLGSSYPIDDNSTETGRKHNRRLTFKIQNQ